MDTDSETLHIMTRIVAAHAKVGRPVLPTDHFRLDLGLDSLGILETMADVEERFRVTIPTDLLETLSTAQELAALLPRLTA